MPNSIQDVLAFTSIVDVHEHHLPEIILGREGNLLQLAFRWSFSLGPQRPPYTLWQPGRVDQDAERGVTIG